MAYGKAIELFLVTGTAESLITAELSNWNGKAIKIPRTEVPGCDRDDVKGAGVYFLICQETMAPTLYISAKLKMCRIALLSIFATTNPAKKNTTGTQL